jgi:hypothetical protein
MPKTAGSEHELKETLKVDVEIPGHEDRTTTALFLHTKKLLLAKTGARCFICNATAAESGHPLESHHKIIERCLTHVIDFKLVQTDCERGMYGEDAKNFDWPDFWQKNDPYLFVDNQLVNGIILCKQHHTGLDAGVHMLPHPFWISQRYMKEGEKFSPTETIEHYQV